MEYIDWMVFGFIIGLITYIIDPLRERGGIISVALLGITGGVIGGFFAILLSQTTSFHLTVIQTVLLGSALFLLLGRTARRVW